MGGGLVPFLPLPGQIHCPRMVREGRLVHVPRPGGGSYGSGGIMQQRWNAAVEMREPLLARWCEESSEVCALVEGGVVFARSRSYDELSGLEPELLQRTLDLAGGCIGEEWEDDAGAWFSLRGRRLVQGGPVFVRVFGPAVIRAKIGASGQRPLSRREAQCLAIALEGHENRAIATLLGLQPETVKVHLRSAYKKLAAGGRAEILARLVEAG